ncbi:MAG: chemotaxis protein CheW [Spirochaetota bacterium]
MSNEEQAAQNQYLTFKLADEVYAIGVNRVQEVLEYTPVTKVPRTAEFMKGVINLRGSVIPVADLRMKFGMEEVEATVETSIIVSEVKLGEEQVVIGMIADAVEEVVRMEPENIEPPPRVGTSVESRFISGIGKMNEQFIIILDVDQVFSAEEVSALAESEAQQ